MKKNTTAVVAIMIALISLVGTGLGFAFTAASSSASHQVVEFRHAEVIASQVTVLDSGLDGSSPGDERFFVVPATSPEGGLLTGSLTVVAPDKPLQSQELRRSDLVFQFGAVEDQMVVGGVAVYEIDDPTLALGRVVTRPILGGSGVFAGATGWVDTTHNEDGTWVHVFHYTK
jgi:hypothetical protein